MCIEKYFDFLVKDYGLDYKYQEFHNCYNGNWNVYTYSYYNKSGCFTIHSLPQRGELDFYYAERFSTNLNELYEKMINISSIEKNIWEKYTKIGIFNNPFFWWSNRKVLETLAEVLKVHISKYGEFFDIKVKSIE